MTLRPSPAFAAMAAIATAMPPVHADGAQAAPTGPQRAFQDHVAYVATFAMPLLIEKCSAGDPGYMGQAAPACFRFGNARQDAIERGRLLTLAELAPDDTLQAYRERVLASRLDALDSGDAGRKQAMCAGALAMLSSGRLPPGEWPGAD